jgi:hypothetical protein
VLVWCAAPVIGEALLRKWRDGIPGAVRHIATVGVVAGLGVLVGQQFFAFASLPLVTLQQMSEAERALNKLNDGVTGRRLWLVPDNNGRPISIISAIMKGGSDPRGVWLEPDSPLVRSAAAGLEFRFERNDNRPVDFKDFSAVFFMARGSVESRAEELNQRYRIDLSQLNCRGALQMATGTVVMCVRPE